MIIQKQVQNFLTMSILTIKDTDYLPKSNEESKVLDLKTSTAPIISNDIIVEGKIPKRCFEVKMNHSFINDMSGINPTVTQTA